MVAARLGSLDKLGMTGMAGVVRDEISRVVPREFLARPETTIGDGRLAIPFVRKNVR
jgi:hypothetical protein